MTALYREFRTAAEIDAHYDVESSVPDLMVYARQYEADSQRARSQLQAHLDVPFGPTPEETLDIFPAAQPGAPVFVFIHGGYWRMLSSKEFSFVALGLVPQGVTTVVVNYALAPAVALDEIARQAAAALDWVRQHIAEYGGDPTRIALGGHSAGAHLAAMCINGEAGRPGGTGAVRSALLVSGLFDLRPLRHSFMQPVLQLDEASAHRNSPLFHIPRTGLKALVAWGEDEPVEFCRQSADFQAAWQRRGNPGEAWPLPGRNHFDVLDTLSDPHSAMCQWLVRSLHAAP